MLEFDYSTRFYYAELASSSASKNVSGSTLQTYVQGRGKNILLAIQLLFQQNAHFFIIKSTRYYNLYFSVLYFCPNMFQPAWVIFRGLKASAWLKLLLITIY
jgi:hypothetical protein